MMLVAIGDMHNRRDGWLCMRFLGTYFVPPEYPLHRTFIIYLSACTCHLYLYPYPM